MARIPMVTRTIITTEVTVLCLNTETAEPFNQTVTLPRTYKDEKAMLREAKKVLNTDTIEAVKVVAHAENQTLYGMLETDFVANAQVLPPRSVAEAEEV